MKNGQSHARSASPSSKSEHPPYECAESPNKIFSVDLPLCVQTPPKLLCTPALKLIFFKGPVFGRGLCRPLLFHLHSRNCLSPRNTPALGG